MLTVASLVAIVSFSIHVADDIVRGMSGGGLENLFGILILLVWLYGTLVLAGRPVGRVIVLLGSLLAALVPVLHMTGRGVGGEFARSSEAFLFIWILYVLGVTGSFAFILAVREMLGQRVAGSDRRAG